MSDNSLPGPVLPSLRGRISKAVVLLWVPMTLLPISLLMAGHLLTLPTPAISVALKTSLHSDATAVAHPGSWFVLHVMAQECGCSQGVMKHLLARGVERPFSEKVLFIGNDEALQKKLIARGFDFEAITSERLKEKYGIEGAPLMLVTNPEGEVAYAGGYSDRLRGEPQDVAILRALAHGDRVAPLPLFGCAVSRELQKKLDPLGLKYSASKEH